MAIISTNIERIKCVTGMHHIVHDLWWVIKGSHAGFVLGD